MLFTCNYVTYVVLLRLGWYIRFKQIFTSGELAEILQLFLPTSICIFFALHPEWGLAQHGLIIITDYIQLGVFISVQHSFCLCNVKWIWCKDRPKQSCMCPSSPSAVWQESVKVCHTCSLGLSNRKRNWTPDLQTSSLPQPHPLYLERRRKRILTAKQNEAQVHKCAQ